MSRENPLERLPKLFDIMRDAYITLEQNIRKLKQKVSTQSGCLNPHDTRALVACVKALTDLSKEERDLIKALKGLDPEKLKELAGKIMNKEQENVLQEEGRPAVVPGVPAGVRYVVRKAGGSGGSGAPSGG